MCYFNLSDHVDLRAVKKNWANDSRVQVFTRIAKNGRFVTSDGLLGSLL